jgi:hypothetical protein
MVAPEDVEEFGVERNFQPVIQAKHGVLEERKVPIVHAGSA